MDSLTQNYIGMLDTVHKLIDQGAYSLQENMQTQVNRVFMELEASNISRAEELKLVSAIQAHTQNIEIASDQKLRIVYDLDDCLVKSLEIGSSESSQLNTTVVKRVGGITGHEIEHVDDDLLRFKTELRRWTRLVLSTFSPFSDQFVFTSASRGYMINVLSLIEAGYSKKSYFSKTKDPAAIYDYFEPQRLSATDFAAGHLVKEGKNVRECVGEKEAEIAILLDDNVVYHQAQPFQGVLVQRFPSRPGDINNQNETDCELLRIAPIVIEALLGVTARNRKDRIQKIVTNAQTDEYWKIMMYQALINWIKEGHILDVSMENKAWVQIQQILDKFAHEKGILVSNTTQLSNTSEWRKAFEHRWHEMIQREKKKLITKFTHEYKRRR